MCRVEESFNPCASQPPEGRRHRKVSRKYVHRIRQPSPVQQRLLPIQGPGNTFRIGMSAKTGVKPPRTME